MWLLNVDGARKRWPERLCEQHGIQRNGDEESEERSGVQGVSSSAWFEIMKVPVGKIPLWDFEDGGLGERRRVAKSRFLGLLFLGD